MDRSQPRLPRITRAEIQPWKYLGKGDESSYCHSSSYSHMLGTDE